ncbi:MAG TPA: cation-translocating P-type ATPase [Capillimicrobium sp.]|nr:cation-translocating P-type ATPase [Capillimicrobium sp.]
MSDSCCGPSQEPKKPAAAELVELPIIASAPAVDACCAPGNGPATDACGCEVKPTPARTWTITDACGCEIEVPDHTAPVQRLHQVREIQLAVVSGVLLLAGVILRATGADTVGTVAEAGALVAGGLTFIPQSARALLRGRLSVGTLMMIAAIGAVILGELAEAATLAFLFSISEALESYALTRTRQGLRALMDLVPDRATVRRGGRELSVDPAELVVGDVLIVRPGERLATDGTIRTGTSALDLSAITGESVPVERGPGEAVYAAAINGSGVLEVDVTARAGENSLARVVRIVEEAQERKGAAQRLSDRVARPLVPGVLVVAFLIAVAGSLISGDPSEWINRALVVLVAASPCAFAIAVPVTVVSAIGAATKSGVLIKGGAALEVLAGIRSVALDKTGTLTRNDPQVIETLTADHAAPEHVLAIAAALEARSDHPLAAAILAAGPDEPPTAQDVEAVAGSGLRGVIDGERARVGRPGFIDPGELAPDIARLQKAGATVVLVEVDDETIGAIAVRDELRAEAPEAVQLLRAAGIGDIAMLTGDNTATAHALADQAGITTVRAELLPEDKLTAVQELQRTHPVAMVGDGINDAPALATAHVGIAMGAVGSDVAIEAADVALMGSDLRALPDTLVHARRAGRIMRQNLALSALILLSLVPLAGAGVLGLATVVAIHELAEVIVIANGVRAARRGAFAHRSSSAPARVRPAQRARTTAGVA